MAKINTSSNMYTIVYSCIVVVLVAFLLAAVSSSLQPISDANVRIDVMNQKLQALNINVEKSEVETTFSEVVKEEIKVENADEPVLRCEVNGETKYVIPLSGKGLWGRIWGYIAINDDMDTVYGVYFGHESETAGLGAEITNKDKFQSQFMGKKLRNSNGEIKLSVVKVGKTEDGVEDMNKCDAVTGATLTSNGVDAMLNESICAYTDFLNANK